MSRLVNTLIKARDPNAELESDIKEMLTEAALVEDGVNSETEHLELSLDIEDLDADLEADSGVTEPVDAADTEAVVDANQGRELLDDRSQERDSSEPDLQALDLREAEALYETVQTLETMEDGQQSIVEGPQEVEGASEKDTEELVTPDIELLAGVEGRALSIEERFRRKQEQAFNTRNIRFLLCGVIPLAIATLFAWQWYAARETPAYEADTVTEIDAAVNADGILLASAVDAAKEEIAFDVLDALESERGAVNSALLAKQRSDIDLLSGDNVGSTPSSNSVMKDTEVLVKKKSVRTNIANLLSDAFASFSRGDLEAAAVSYEAVLAEQASNTDALNGLGTIALSNQSYSDALEYFHNALSADPTNAYAMAMLRKIEITSSVETTRVATILSKGYVSSNGEDYFVLGHSYAAEGKWSSAQEMFFQAYSLDKSNSTYAYHLAVSLEHLGKRNLAIPYYKLALENFDGTSVAFDKETIEQRLDLIAPS